jgi:hypothetical protein
VGAIVSDLPQLAADNAPDRIQRYEGVYADLIALGLVVPAFPANVISRVTLLAHLQGLIGEAVKAELLADPDEIYNGASPTDAVLAARISDPYDLPFLRRFPGTGVYRCAVGTTAASLTLVEIPGAIAPDFASIPGLANNMLQLLVRLGPLTNTIALRGVFRRISAIGAPTNILALTTALPVAPSLTDIVRIGVAPQDGNFRMAARLSQFLTRIPYAPNALTAADITAAKV